MKRFLIFFILISFVTVSCAGHQVKYRWTKPDFISQEQFEKDRQECVDSIDRDGLSSEDFQKAFDECFVKKGYERPQEKEYPIGVKILVGVGIVALVAVGVAVLAAYVLLYAFAGAP